ncbi:MAG TPA: hypothetical protein K8V48_04410, partial [Limosilactobacillus oris]|uniref:hypothetical protein n=1 Tax=Limosilactobacillus oris TaxID=1632 RepID=UPI001E1774C9
KLIKRINFANVFASITEVTEDPTHLIRRNFVQFSKVYQTVTRQLLHFITATTIKSTTNFKQLFVSSQTSSLNNISCCQNDVNNNLQFYFCKSLIALTTLNMIHGISHPVKHHFTTRYPPHEQN